MTRLSLPGAAAGTGVAGAGVVGAGVSAPAAAGSAQREQTTRATTTEREIVFIARSYAAVRESPAWAPPPGATGAIRPMRLKSRATASRPVSAHTIKSAP